MENKISQSFKVQWLNSTLKFVKNVNQMFMEYPQMPIAQVEYLCNLMWQRENNVGLGFKSLYAPLWEAMSIYSVKYQFEVSVTKAESGELGQLKIRKVPKTTNEDCDKPPLEPDIREMQNSTSPACEEPVIHQKIKSANQECAKVLESNNDERVKTKPKKPSKGQKYLVHARKIIDSIAPAFFKTTFQKIFDFIKDEASASFTFSDLAPNEAKFLENFLGIYNRRTYFAVFFSPYCNDLLDKMCISFKEFDKNSKLEIFVGKTDTKTCKREIVFLKVPRYTKNTSSKAKLSKNTNGQLSSENETDSSSCKFLKALKKTDFSTNGDHNTSNFKSNSDSRTIDNTDIETDDEFNATDKENVKSMVFNNVNLKDVQDTALVNTEKNSEFIEISNKSKMKCAVQAKEVLEFKAKSINHTDLNNENETKCPKTIDLTSYNETNKTTNVFAKAIEKIEKKEDREKVLPESKEKKNIVDNSNINDVSKDMKEIKVTINNKKETDMTEDIKEKMRSVYLKDNNTKKTPQIPKTGIPFAKASNSTENEKVVDKSIDAKVIQCSRKHKLLEAMSTPLESDKALRMMRLMGWEGGALGLRGEGIIEPIIPALNIKPGAGLGHVSEKSKKKQDKLSNRLQLLEAILDIITKDITESIILCNNDVTKKEKRSFNEIINLVNMNRPLNLANKYENDICQKIYENMADAQFQLVLVHDSNRSFTICKVKEKPETNAVTKKKNAKTVTVDEINNTLSKISLTVEDQSALCQNKTDNAPNKQETVNNTTDKKDINNENVKDNNNNDDSKEVNLNKGQSEVSSNSSSPTKNKPYILLVKAKTKKCPKHIANLITTKINSEIEFSPYLKSHGIQDGYIVYSCYKKRSYLWLKNVLTDYRVIDYRGIDELYVLKLEMNVNIDCNKVLSLLEKYNSGLNCGDWDVIDVKYLNCSTEFLVQLEFNSFEYVRNNNFRLPAGVDEVKFSINVEYYSSYLSIP